ncbi:phospholipase B1, membrane-associated-like [Pogonomyrmex barbatus]|uniref:Phospholipase B1, membrane-associated-like n=1 Tax=Pogonomyrmex barbatus TaxID=144034 RepID=A0A6I9W650_9HYME|nr:phospholipase B1, membrane-associated-like [Pogonomyrmex barbatus]
MTRPRFQIRCIRVFFVSSISRWIIEYCVLERYNTYLLQNTKFHSSGVSHQSSFAFCLIIGFASSSTMWKWWFYCILLHVSLSTSRRTALDTPFNILFLRAFRDWTFDVFGRTGTEERFLRIARNANKIQETIPDYVPFPCNVTGRTSKSYYYIFLIFILLVILVIFSTYFYEKYIHEFNPNLVGYALGDSLTTHQASQLNVAETGAESEDMPFMAEVLVKKIKNDPRIDLQKHWKFISIMIGANDFCTEICWVSSPWSILEKHKADLLQVLRTLRDNLPRTFVALIQPPNLKALVDTRKGRSSFNCFIMTDFECSCLFGLSFRRFRPMYYDIMRRFTVVAQPVLTEAQIPLASDGYTDMTYLSTDCFHITQKSNAYYASSLWNNLLEPVGTKMTKWHKPFDNFHCPTPERPYLATILNSM